jgi:hypothetical protein
MLRAIRTGHLDQFACGEVSQFVRHLALRLPSTRRLLEVIAQGILALLKCGIQELPCPPMPDRTFQDLFNESIAIIKERGNNPTTIREIIQFLSDNLKRDVGAVFQNHIMNTAMEVVDRVDLLANVRELHSEAILDELIGIQGPSENQELSWSIRHSDNPLILGDIGPLSISPGDGSIEPVVGGKRDGRAVLLAVDINTWIVGAQHFPARQVSAKEWNDAVARYSEAMFIGDRRCDDFIALAAQLGESRSEFSFSTFVENNPEFGAKFKEAMQSRVPQNYPGLMTTGALRQDKEYLRSIRKYFTGGEGCEGLGAMS